MTSTKKRLLILGPYAPPSGGVSMHIKRLSSILKEGFILDFVDETRIKKPHIFNIRGFNLIMYLSKIIKSDILFIHSGKSRLRILHILAGRLFAKKIVLTVHRYPEKKSKFSLFIESAIFNLSNKIVVVNSNILDYWSFKKSKYVIKDAFIPPTMSEEAELPTEILNWVKGRRATGKLVMCANAWRLEIFRNEDRYGVDLCIELMKRFKERRIPAALIFIISSDPSKNPKFLQYLAMIKDFDLDDRILLVSLKNLSFVKLIEECDIVLRPTNVDGDALTIREAMFLGKPVLASDVIERPQGTHLFKNRDINDFENKVINIIDIDSRKQASAPKSGLQDYSEFYINLLSSV